MNRIFHVAVTGCDRAEGSAEHPFRTISKAAALAQAGDRVIVHEGEYREWVKPQNGGKNEICRITYEAAPGEKTVIKGSERITCWEPFKGTVWKATLPNSFFGDYNPYAEALWGDWFIYPTEYQVHTGEVYLNGRSFYEAPTLEEVLQPKRRELGFNPPWTGKLEPIPHPENTVYQWFAEVTEENTVLYANFQGADPNRELTEINVRPYCFYPEKTGLNYITVRGFEIAQAACPFTPPTADQPGMVGPHWSKGWIIENNRLHDAKCSAVSLGKERSTGDNNHMRTLQKPGYQYQMEAVFLALEHGWSKLTIGSHIVRNNTIYDCGQNGIVGHMGCAFSEIYGNEIYNIAVKHEFFGYEIAGIKLHAALDVKIHNNHIHDCTLGTWLDWQAQGVRISRNLYHHNMRDLFIEVSHGPYLVDHNILASSYSLDNASQGGAYIGNLFCGSLRRIKVLDRSTPYHFPHTTAVAGTALVFSGDDRFYNNIFVGGMEITAEDSSTGTAGYNGCNPSYEAYLSALKAHADCDHVKYFDVEQPVYIKNNAYFKAVGHFEQEESLYDAPDFDPKVEIQQEPDGVYLQIELPEALFALPTQIHSTQTLGTVRMADAIFDDPDGRPITLDHDYFGCPHNCRPVPGPIEALKPGLNRIKVC